MLLIFIYLILSRRATSCTNSFFIIPFIAVFLFVNSAISADKVKVGFIATLSGPAASLGEDILNGFTLGIKNSNGKLGGLDVDLVTGDDQLKPGVGVQVASKMVEKDKVDIVTGIVFPM